jgi:hypothetical protein
MPTRSQRHVFEIQRTVNGLRPSTGPAAPVITSPPSLAVVENTAFSAPLTASEAVTWAKSGTDAALFTLAGNTLSMIARDYEAPADADQDNTYIVQLTATSVATGLTAIQVFSLAVMNTAIEGFITDFTTLPDSDLSAVSGWARIIGVANGAAVRSGRLAGLDTGAPGSLYWCLDQGNMNHFVEITLPNPLPTNSGPFAVCRADGTGQNYIGIRSLNNFVECYKREASNMVSLYTSGPLLVAGDVLRLECNAGNYAIKRNGTQIQTGAINNGTLVSTRQGFIARSVTVNPFATKFAAGVI